MKRKGSITDKIFILGLITIPFDNLFFAPSAGWATISPIIFMVYIVSIFIFDRRSILNGIGKNIKFIFGIYIFIIYGIFMSLINGIHINNLIDSIIAIGLGITIYLSFYIRYIIQKRKLVDDFRYLFYAYIVSIIYGIFKYLALEKISFLSNIFNIIEKRHYNRNSFSFTEPSFISIHLYGLILLVIAYIDNKYIKKKWKKMLAIYIITVIMIGGSSRFIVDSLVILGCYCIYKAIKCIKKGKAGFPIFIVSILIIGVCIFNVVDFSNINTTNKSIQRTLDILDNGLYSDPSLGSRLIRIEAQIAGYKNYKVKAMFGAGLGNTYKFVQSGYNDVRSKWIHPFDDEVNSLQYSQSNAFFCMYTKIISEFGIIGMVIILFSLMYFTIKYKGNLLAVLVILNLYFQFDSYMFYSIWLYIVLTIKKYNEEIEFKNK